jgi:hypothetical protein
VGTLDGFGVGIELGGAAIEGEAYYEYRVLLYTAFQVRLDIVAPN